MQRLEALEQVQPMQRFADLLWGWYSPPYKASLWSESGMRCPNDLDSQGA